MASNFEGEEQHQNPSKKIRRGTGTKWGQDSVNYDIYLNYLQ